MPKMNRSDKIKFIIKHNPNLSNEILDKMDDKEFSCWFDYCNFLTRKV